MMDSAAGHLVDNESNWLTPLSPNERFTTLNAIL
jgi:hypothetical protein